jgi:hypothetical protein
MACEKVDQTTVIPEIHFGQIGREELGGRKTQDEEHYSFGRWAGANSHEALGTYYTPSNLSEIRGTIPLDWQFDV